MRVLRSKKNASSVPKQKLKSHDVMTAAQCVPSDIPLKIRKLSNNYILHLRYMIVLRQLRGTRIRLLKKSPQVSKTVPLSSRLEEPASSLARARRKAIHVNPQHLNYAIRRWNTSF